MPSSTDALVVAAVNASLPRSIAAPELARVIGEAASWPRYRAHLCAFFTEVPLGAIETFAAEHAIAPTVLARSYHWVVATTGDQAPDVDEWLTYLGYATA